METFNTKIKRIRSTIDDIRLDIESMKYVNNILNILTLIEKRKNVE
jgi:hypothetical protein